MIDLCQAKTKMVTGLLQAYVEYIPPAEMICLRDIVCNYPGGLHVSAATWPCVYLLEIQRCSGSVDVKSWQVVYGHFQSFL